MEAIVSVAVLAVLGAFAVWLMVRRIEAAHADVRTLKGQQTIGTITSEGESRRIELIPPGERTAKEQRHLDRAALKDAPLGDESAADDEPD